MRVVLEASVFVVVKQLNAVYIEHLFIIYIVWNEISTFSQSVMFVCMWMLTRATASVDATII